MKHSPNGTPTVEIKDDLNDFARQMVQPHIDKALKDQAIMNRACRDAELRDELNEQKAKFSNYCKGKLVNQINQMEIKNVKELKDYLRNLPDETEIKVIGGGINTEDMKQHGKLRDVYFDGKNNKLEIEAYRYYV